MSLRNSVHCLTLVLMLGSCSKTANPPPGHAAGGEVLPGTISDAMLETDRSRAQPLLQPAPRTRATDSDTSGAASDAAPDEAAAAPVAPAAAN